MRSRAPREAEIIEEVTRLEEDVLEQSEDPESLRYEDDQAIEILRAVLEVALEDEAVSHEEPSLLSKLRRKLGMQPRPLTLAPGSEEQIS